MRFVILIAASLLLLACNPETSTPPASVMLFKVDFGSPANTVGAAPAVADSAADQASPRSLPSSIFMGEATVVPRLCGLEKQPVQLSLESGTQPQSGLVFSLESGFYGHYHLEFDLCVANLGLAQHPGDEPQLAVYLDIPEAHALGFTADGQLVAIDPARGSDSITNPTVIGSYAFGKPMHFALDFDVVKQSWSIAVDGKGICEGHTLVTVPHSVRFVIRGIESNAAAIDDVVIWAENDLSKQQEVPFATPDPGTKE